MEHYSLIRNSVNLLILKFKSNGKLMKNKELKIKNDDKRDIVILCPFLYNLFFLISFLNISILCVKT